MSVHFRPDYFNFPHQYFSKLNDSISESRYCTSSDRTMLWAFFEVNISKLPSWFLLALTQDRWACLNRHSPVLEKIIKIKVLNIFDSFLFYYVANNYVWLHFFLLDIGTYSHSVII